MRKTTLMVLGIAALAVACNKTEEFGAARQPEPKLPEQPYNYKNQQFAAYQWTVDNQLSDVTDAKATLGRVLFFDTKLSVNNAISCGSCHKQNVAFADMGQFSSGFRGVQTKRNSPPTFNVAMNGQLFWDLRAPSLMEQVLMPAFDHVEMGMSDMGHLIGKVQATDYYAPLFSAAFGSDEVTEEKIRIAIRDFLTSMISLDSKYDRSINSDMGTTSLVGLEKLGEQLFNDKARCSSCHGGTNFSGWGGANIGLEMDYVDQGVASWTASDGNIGVFKIPTLRNVALTAPYMHDGRFRTLDEVIDHYNSNIQAHPNLDFRLREGDFWGFGNGFEGDALLLEDPFTGSSSSDAAPVRLGLTDHEKAAIKAFLMTLTDYSLINDPKFSDPFVYEK